jgi:hypothetical protein
MKAKEIATAERSLSGFSQFLPVFVICKIF